MRIFSAVLEALSLQSSGGLSTVTDHALDRFDTSSGKLADNSIPGNNSLAYCSDLTKNILHIDRVDFEPNPPERGQNLTVTGVFSLDEEVPCKSYVNVVVKYGFITLINGDHDLCDSLKETELNCPVSKDVKSFKHTLTLPSQIPPGTYTVRADVYTEYGERITCLTTVLTFTLFGGTTADSDDEQDARFESVKRTKFENAIKAYRLLRNG